MLETFLESNKPLFGLDIGTNTLKVVFLSRSGKQFRIDSLNSVTCPPRSYQKTGLNNKPQLIEAVELALREAQPKPIKTRAISLSIPESLVFTKTILIPKLKESEIKKSIDYQISDFLPIPIEEVYYDWQLLPSDKTDQSEILAVAVPKTLIDDIIETFSQAGFEIRSIETKPISAARSVIKAGEKNPLILIDIGSENSNISIIDNGHIKITGIAKTGGDLLVRNIAQSQNTDPKAVAGLLWTQGLEAIPKELLDTNLTILTEEISHLTKYFTNRLGYQKEIKEIRVCGGTASMKGLIEYIHAKTGIKTVIANPLVNISRYPKEIITNYSTKYSVAIGAAMRN